MVIVLPNLSPFRGSGGLAGGVARHVRVRAAAALPVVSAPERLGVDGYIVGVDVGAGGGQCLRQLREGP